MKRLPLYGGWIVLLAGLLLAGCGDGCGGIEQPKSASAPGVQRKKADRETARREKRKKEIPSLSRKAERNPKLKTARDGLGDERGLTPLSHKKLARFLPAAPQGWEASATKGYTAKDAEDRGLSFASRDYTKENGRIAVTLMDVLNDPSRTGAARSMVERMRKTEGVQSAKIREEDLTGVEYLDKANGKAYQVLLLQGRVMIEIKAEGDAGIGALKDLRRRINLDEMRRWLNKARARR